MLVSDVWQRFADYLADAYVFACEGNNEYNFYESLCNAHRELDNLTSTEVDQTKVSSLVSMVSSLTILLCACKGGIIVPSMVKFVEMVEDNGEFFSCMRNSKEFLAIVRDY